MEMEEIRGEQHVLRLSQQNWHQKNSTTKVFLFSLMC